MRIFA